MWAGNVACSMCCTNCLGQCLVHKRSSQPICKRKQERKGRQVQERKGWEGKKRRGIEKKKTLKTHTVFFQAFPHDFTNGKQSELKFLIQ